MYFADFEKQLAGQGVAIGVQAVRGQAQDHVAHFDRLAADDALALDRAHDESGQVVFAIGIEARHLGGFPADQGTAVVLAGFGQAFNDFLGDFRLDLARGQVVHEEERRGALHRDVVDAMIDQVGADGVMDVHLEGDFQLRAHAVHARHQNRVHPLRLVHGEQAAEAADFAQYAAGKSLVGEILDPLFGAVGAVNVHPGVGVGDGGLRGIMGHGSQCVSLMWGFARRR